MSICAAIDEVALKRLETAGTRIDCSPKAILFMEGEPASDVYIPTSGMLRAFRVLEDGRCQILGFIMPGDFIGSDGGRRTYSVDAAGPAIVCRFPRGAFWERLPNEPHSLATIYTAIARCLGQAHDQITLLGKSDARGKVAGFLADMAKRSRRIRDTGAFLALPMSRRDIGDYLGLNISTVSRTLQRLARSGRITIVRGGVRVLDPQGLARDSN